MSHQFFQESIYHKRFLPKTHEFKYNYFLIDIDTLKLETLKTDKDAFIADANQTNLDELRASWLEAYKVWQHVEMFNIGKAEELLYGFQMNIYPVSTTDVTILIILA